MVELGSKIIYMYHILYVKNKAPQYMKR